MSSGDCFELEVKVKRFMVEGGMYVELMILNGSQTLHSWVDTTQEVIPLNQQLRGGRPNI